MGQSSTFGMHVAYLVHAEPERTSCVYCAVPGCGDHASTELGQGPSRGVVSPYAPQSPTLVSNPHHIPAPQHGAAVDWLVHAHVLGTRGTERCGVIADNVPIACYGSNALTLGAKLRALSAAHLSLFGRDPRHPPFRVSYRIPYRQRSLRT